MIENIPKRARPVMLGMFFCMLLAGCATGPAYRPAAQPGDYGYRDSAITNDQIRVSFSGGYGLAREQVEEFAMFRAADVALAHDSPRFLVISRQTSPITTTDTSSSANVGYGFGYPFWGAGFGVPITTTSRTRYESVLNIQVGSQVPAKGPNVYDASQVKQHLSPSVAGADD